MKLELINTISKSYGLADSKEEFIVYCCQYDGSIRASLNISRLSPPNGQRIWAGDIHTIEKIYESLSKAAPVNINIFDYNNGQILDQEVKADILNRLVVVEQTDQNSTILRSVTPNAIKKIKEVTLLQGETNSIIHNVLSKVRSFPANKCQKLKELLKEFN